MKNDKDTQLMMEAYDDVANNYQKGDGDVLGRGSDFMQNKPVTSNIDKAIHVDDKNVTHEYNDQELHEMAIIALKDMLNGMKITSKDKVEWLISMLQRKARN